MRTCLPPARSPPSGRNTLRLSSEGLERYVPEVPSAQVLPRVLGALRSGPTGPRPAASQAVLHWLPRAAQAGAPRAMSKVALPALANVSEMPELEAELQPLSKAFAVNTPGPLVAVALSHV